MDLTALFKKFFDSERIGGILLFFCTLVSLVVANSSLGEGYLHFWHMKADLSFAGLDLNLSVEQWVNDGLMSIFFLLVGLEIERELYAGELSTVSHAVLPVVAAVGGMLVPAAIHLSINGGTPTQNGFGIPMATDIAFSLGMLALLGNRVPHALKIFLAALAIIDDLGAILVIAIFYSGGVQWLYLGIAGAIIAVLHLLSRLKINHLAIYLLPGLVLWYCMLKSGIHPTIAGVLLAFVIPFSGEHRDTSSYKLQHFLHKPVGFIIVPIFALANTGIVLNEGWIKELTSTNSLGIVAGLVVGKPVGILLFSWLAILTGKGSLPYKVKWTQLAGAGILAGIGFTMSIFISNLAFSNAELVEFSKISVLLASLIATIVGLLVLWAARSENDTEPSPEIIAH